MGGMARQFNKVNGLFRVFRFTSKTTNRSTCSIFLDTGTSPQIRVQENWHRPPSIGVIDGGYPGGRQLYPITHWFSRQAVRVSAERGGTKSLSVQPIQRKTIWPICIRWGAITIFLSNRRTIFINTVKFRFQTPSTQEGKAGKGAESHGIRLAVLIESA